MLPPASAPCSFHSKPRASPRQGPVLPNRPAGSRRPSITSVVPDTDQALSTAEVDDQFGTIFKTMASRERNQAPECRSGQSLSMGNRSATPRALFADRIIAQEEFAAKVVQEEFAAKAQAAVRALKKEDVAQGGGGGLRSVVDQELDAYSPDTSESDAFEVMNRIKSMMKVLGVDNQELFKLGCGSQPMVIAH